jgi:hypothetical protein
LRGVLARWYRPATVDPGTPKEVSRNVMTKPRIQEPRFAARTGGALVATVLLAP